jgi:RNA polymerase sigma-70 factor (ECF subfamily)
VGLAELFLRHAGDATRTRTAGPELEAALVAMLDAARTSWPEVQLDVEAFLAHLAERLPPSEDPIEALRSMHAADLYLACACVRGDPPAIGAFERGLLSHMPEYIGRIDATPGFAEEVKQAVRTRLLVAESGALPRIASYNGRGPLGAWVRMVSARVAVDLHREQVPRGSTDDDEALLARASPSDPELAYLKTHYRAVFETAFRQALAALSPKEANVLRLHFLEGIPSSAIGTIYQVSGRTVNRWIADIRQRILAEARGLLCEALHLPHSQLESVLELVRSQMDLSLPGDRKKPDG